MIHQDSLAAGFDRQFLQLVPHRLRKSRARIIHEPELLEESIAKLAALAQERQNHFEAARHVQEDVGLHFVEIANGGFDGAGHGPAVVDVIRSAVVQHQSEIVIAGEGVVPGQPIAQHRRISTTNGSMVRTIS